MGWRVSTVQKTKIESDGSENNGGPESCDLNEGSYRKGLSVHCRMIWCQKLCVKVNPEYVMWKINSY